MRITWTTNQIPMLLGLGSNFNAWTSTPNDSRAFWYGLRDDGRDMDVNGRAVANSVRCFANDYLTSPAMNVYPN